MIRMPLLCGQCHHWVSNSRLWWTWTPVSDYHEHGIVVEVYWAVWRCLVVGNDAFVSLIPLALPWVLLPWWSSTKLVFASWSLAGAPHYRVVIGPLSILPRLVGSSVSFEPYTICNTGSPSYWCQRTILWNSWYKPFLSRSSTHVTRRRVYARIPSGHKIVIHR